MAGPELQQIANLKARYCEPQRHYHTWAHVATLLRLYETVELHLHRPAPVLWAIYYHDAIYDPQAKDNEDQSARLLHKEAVSYLPPEDLSFAEIIIRATAHHVIPAGLSAGDTADLGTFLDMDLSILAAPPPIFDQYERDIRAEYAFVSDDAFRKGRGAILAGFLERPHLYFTQAAQKNWELPARANLTRSLAGLMPTCE